MVRSGILCRYVFARSRRSSPRQPPPRARRSFLPWSVLHSSLCYRYSYLPTVDFGYILGRDPKPFPPAIKVCKEMVDAMGGVSSPHYARFKSLSYTAFTSLRKNSNLIINLVALMVDGNIPDIKLEPDKAVTKVCPSFLFLFLFLFLLLPNTMNVLTRRATGARQVSTRTVGGGSDQDVRGAAERNVVLYFRSRCHSFCCSVLSCLIVVMHCCIIRSFLRYAWKSIMWRTKRECDFVHDEDKNA